MSTMERYALIAARILNSIFILLKFDLSNWNGGTLKTDSTAGRGAEVIFNTVGSPVFGSALELLVTGEVHHTFLKIGQHASRNAEVVRSSAAKRW